MKSMSKLHKKLVRKRCHAPRLLKAKTAALTGGLALVVHGQIDDIRAVEMFRLRLTTNRSPRLPRIPGPAVRKHERAYLREKNWARKKRRYRRHLRYRQAMSARMFCLPWAYKFV